MKCFLPSLGSYQGAIAPETQNLSGLQTQAPHLQLDRSCLKSTNLNAGVDTAWLLQNLTGPKEAVWCHKRPWSRKLFWEIFHVQQINTFPFFKSFHEQFLISMVFDPSNNTPRQLGPISVVFQRKEPQGISWATVNSYFVMELVSVMAEKWRLLKIWHLGLSLTSMDWRAQRRHQIKNDTIEKKYPGTFFSFENYHLDFFHAHKKNSGMQSNTCAQLPVKLLRFICLVKGK